MRIRSIRLLGYHLLAAASVCILPLRAGEGVASASSATGDARNVSVSNEAPASAAKRGVRNSRYPFRGRLKALDLKAKTFTVAGAEKDRVFQTDDQTAFTRGGQPAALSDGVAGETVGGLLEKQADGGLLALKVRFGPKMDDPNQGGGSGGNKGTASKSRKTAN